MTGRCLPCAPPPTSMIVQWSLVIMAVWEPLVSRHLHDPADLSSLKRAPLNNNGHMGLLFVNRERRRRGTAGTSGIGPEVKTLLIEQCFLIYPITVSPDQPKLKISAVVPYTVYQIANWSTKKWCYLMTPVVRRNRSDLYKFKIKIEDKILVSVPEK